MYIRRLCIQALIRGKTKINEVPSRLERQEGSLLKDSRSKGPVGNLQDPCDTWVEGKRDAEVRYTQESKDRWQLASEDNYTQRDEPVESLRWPSACAPLQRGPTARVHHPPPYGPSQQPRSLPVLGQVNHCCRLSSSGDADPQGLVCHLISWEHYPSACQAWVVI